MNKKFIYTYITESVYLTESDEYEEFGDDFNYTVNEEELIDAMTNILFRKYYGKTELKNNKEYSDVVKKGLKSIIENNCLIKQLVEDYEDQLRDYFEDDAITYYENNY